MKQDTHIRRTANRAPILALIALLSCLMAFGASDALAKKHNKRHRSSTPSGPSLAQLQTLQCAKYNCDAKTTVTKLTVLTRGTVHRGSGRTARVGGDGIPTDTWIYPMLMSYDETTTGGHYTGGGYQPLVWVVTHSTAHVREKDNVLREPTGAFVLRIVSATTTCDASDTGCTPGSVGGGA